MIEEQAEQLAALRRRARRIEAEKDAQCVVGVSNLQADNNLPSPTNVTFTMRFSAAANQSVDCLLIGKQGG